MPFLGIYHQFFTSDPQHPLLVKCTDKKHIMDGEGGLTISFIEAIKRRPEPINPEQIGVSWKHNTE